jgi:hypothetical protein
MIRLFHFTIKESMMERWQHALTQNDKDFKEIFCVNTGQ